LMFISIITTPAPFHDVTVVRSDRSYGRSSGRPPHTLFGPARLIVTSTSFPSHCGGPGKVDHRVAAGAARQLPLAPAAGRVDQHLAASIQSTAGRGPTGSTVGALAAPRCAASSRPRSRRPASVSTPACSAAPST
jgi:hypothetical protein